MANYDDIDLIQLFKWKLSVLKCRYKVYFEKKKKLAYSRCKTKFDDIEVSVNSFKCNINQKVNGVGDIAIDTFEDFISKIRENRLNFTSSVGYYYSDLRNVEQNVEDDIELFIARWKDFLIEIKGKWKSLGCELSETKENVIDQFEEFIERLKDRQFFSSVAMSNRIGGVKDKMEDNFENLLENWKDYLVELKEKIKSIGCELDEKKENAIDEFEQLIARLQDIGLHTGYHVAKIECVKEKVIDNFENLLQRCNDHIESIEDSLKCYANEKKTAVVNEFDSFIDDLKDQLNSVQWDLENKTKIIVDDFEDLVEDTKWTFEDRRKALIEDAECAFENALEKAEHMIDEGKQEIKAEFCVFNHALCLGEHLIKDFLCFSERIMGEFLNFSEKRVACFLCQARKKAEVFYNEVVDSLVRGYEDKLLCDNLVLEINSSRYAYNVTMSEVNLHVVRALLTLPGPDGRSWQQLASRLTYFMPILTNYIRSSAAQKDCLLGIEDVAGTHPEIFDVIVKIIHWLYEQDILSEEAILDWYYNPCCDSDDVNAKRVRNQVAPFIIWLKEAEEQSSDSDDD